jgi:hypothetical protein
MTLKLTTLAILALSAVGLAQAGSSANPFSSQESQLLSGVWPKIREARDFDDIDWHAVGLTHAPGDSDARRVLADHWSKLRGERDFDDIDWRAIRDDESGHSHTLARDDLDTETGPFTRDEARELSNAWPKIREADSFDDIDWRSVGLDRAPGDRDAREFMAEHWSSLRRANRFDDIDWRAESRDR